jgi:hypothetical protein
MEEDESLELSSSLLSSWTLMTNSSLTVKNPNCPTFAVRLWIITPLYHWPIRSFPSTCMFCTTPYCTKDVYTPQGSARDLWTVAEMGSCQKLKKCMKSISSCRMKYKKRKTSIKLHEICPTRPTYILTNKISEKAFEFFSCRNGSWLVSNDFTSLPWSRNSSASLYVVVRTIHLMWAVLYSLW